MIRKLLFTSLLLSSLTLTGAAIAVEPDEEPSAGPSHHDRPYFHDGLYLRMAVGTGGMRWRDQAVSNANVGDTNVNAAGGAAEFSLGGTPSPGFVVAGSLLAFGSAYGDMNDGSGSTHMDKTIGYALFGATLDFFPDPRSGFHFGGTLGPAVATKTEDDRVNRRWTTTAGAGFSVAAGYDWWIARQWSLGFLVRATGARFWGSVTYDDATDTTTHEHDSRRAVGTLSILFTGLYH